jgi:hypothetical protein
MFDSPGVTPGVWRGGELCASSSQCALAPPLDSCEGYPTGGRGVSSIGSVSSRGRLQPRDDRCEPMVPGGVHAAPISSGSSGDIHLSLDGCASPVSASAS